ncbi:MAG: hypothetical protein M1826_000658 [Phylliscum demangeonii]|nr:MAG: hypothetical protein M1826_000658 [Phylliscum demangeonii]
MISIMTRSSVIPTATPAPAVPRPLKQSSKVRTRQEAGLDSSPPSRDRVAKRSRIDSDKPARTVNGSESGLETVRKEVRRAVEQYCTGDETGYARLVELFSKSPTSDQARSSTCLQHHLLALSSIVSQLDRTYWDLVTAVLACEWLGRGETFVQIYVRFLGNLVSAHGTYIEVVLRMLVDQLGSGLPPSRQIPGHASVPERQLFARAHVALKYLFELVPSASSALLGILTTSFPHSSDGKKAHSDYVRNLLRMTEYVPEVKVEILALITERLVKIDVKVQVDMDDLEDDAEEVVVQDTRDHRRASAEPEDDLVSDDGSADSDDSLHEEGRRIKDLRSSVSKMDAILDQLFEYYTPHFTTSSAGEAEQTFDILLNQFSTIILPTYRSRHSQFLLFHFAQTSPLLTDMFAGTCVYHAIDRNRPMLVRQSAVAYLASFVARSAHISVQMVRDVFQLLGVHLDNIRTSQEAACRGPDLKRFGIYYSLVQALLYIFCFRWRDLATSPTGDEEDLDDVIADGHDLRWASGIKGILLRCIYSKFNPLKVCSGSIVNEFARIAHHLRFLYIYSLLESNKRVQLFKSSSSSYTTATSGPVAPTSTSLSSESPKQLDTYFPFDPYHLPVSKRWIQGDYVEWRAIDGLDDNRVVGGNSIEGRGERAIAKAARRSLEDEDDI